MTGPRGSVEWRCRRGSLELDTLVQRYFRDRYPVAPANERAAFERLLDLPDPELQARLIRRRAEDEPEMARVVEWILAGPDH